MSRYMQASETLVSQWTAGLKQKYVPKRCQSYDLTFRDVVEMSAQLARV